MKQLDFIFFDAGGGHRSAATALEQVTREQQRPWQVRLVNLQEALDPIDFMRKFTGLRMQDIYNLLLKNGWTLGLPTALGWMHGVIRHFHKQQVELLREFWRESPPDLVVSMVPHFNRAIGEGLRAVAPRTPLTPVITDLADYPPHFWIEQQTQYFICGTRKAVEQARSLGHDDSRVFQASGMILNPRFYHTTPVDRKAERQRLGLDADLPAGLVMFGGAGSSVMVQIARRLEAADLPLQLILLAGHNLQVKKRLERMKHRKPFLVEGFTREAPYFMQLADFFIGKPGPASISEALHMGLPVIVEHNAWTLPQERYNADWLVENGYGMALPDFRGIASAVGRLLQPQTLAAYRERAASLNNRAVFEIPDFLEKILRQGA